MPNIDSRILPTINPTQLNDLTCSAGSGFTLNYTAGTLLLAGVSTSISAGTLAMTSSSTNYVFVNSLGVVTSNTTGFPTTGLMFPMAVVTTSGSAITAVTDKRPWLTAAGNSTTATLGELLCTAGTFPNLNFAAGTVLINGVSTVVAAGSIALSVSATNYVYVSAAGTVTTNTTGFPASVTIYPMAIVTTSGSAITAITDKRPWLTASGPLTNTSVGNRNTLFQALQDGLGNAAFLSTPTLGVINSATQAASISGGDGASQGKALAFDGSTSTYWASSQNATNQSAAAYIGQDAGLNNTVSIGGFTLLTAPSANNNMTSVLFQTSPDGTTWTTQETLTLTTTASTTINQKLQKNYGTRAWRLLANANIGAFSWNVYDLQAFSYVASVDLKATSTPVIGSFANGYSTTTGAAVDYPFAITADQSAAWNNLTNNNTNYLYLDRNSTTGAISYTAFTVPQVVSTAPPTTSSTIPAPTNLWGFNESSGTTVADANGSQNGTATGTTVVAGKIGNARSFNGTSDYVATTLVPNLTTYTFAAWVMTNSIPASQPATIVSDCASSNANTSCRVDLYLQTTAKFQAIFGNGTTSSVVTFSGYTVPTATLIHVAMTVDGTNAKLYINGSLADTQAQGTALSGAAGGHLTFGRNGDYTGPNNYFWNGTIDEAYLFQNTVLGASQIAALYNSVNNVQATNIWHMDEASGTAVADIAGGAIGTATGTTIVSGKYGNARSFNGTSDYVATTLVPSCTTYSLAAWISPANVAPAGNLYFIADINSAASNPSSRVALAITPTGKLLASFGNGSAYTAPIFSYTFSVNVLVHILVTADGTNAKLYVNGSLVDTQPQGTPLSGSAGGHLTFGRAGDNAGFYFSGTLDEVYLFQNTVLTASQVAAFYSSGQYPNTAVAAANVNAVPTMTSNTAPSGTASCSTAYDTINFDAWKAFDGITSTRWGTSNAVTTGWLQYQFPANQTIVGYAITSSGSDAGATGPKTWVMQGSTNGSSWTTLDTQTNVPIWAVNETRTYTLGTTGSYNYYRITVSANQGDPTYLVIGELKLFTAMAASSSTNQWYNPVTGLAQVWNGSSWVPVQRLQVAQATVGAVGGVSAVTYTCPLGTANIAGNINAPGNSSFRAYQLTGQSISSQVYTKVTFPLTNWDALGEFDTVNNRFVAKQSGRYRFYTGVSVSSTASSQIQAMFYVNGVAYSQLVSGSQSTTGQNQTAGGSATITLNSGDYVEVYAWGTQAYTLNTASSSAYVYFGGEKVG